MHGTIQKMNNSCNTVRQSPECSKRVCGRVRMTNQKVLVFFCFFKMAFPSHKLSKRLCNAASAEDIWTSYFDADTEGSREKCHAHSSPQKANPVSAYFPSNHKRAIMSTMLTI